MSFKVKRHMTSGYLKAIPMPALKVLFFQQVMSFLRNEIGGGCKEYRHLQSGLRHVNIVTYIALCGFGCDVRLVSYLGDSVAKVL